jgi:RNA polymerase sigma-70 factor (ECF subfamily)
MLAFQAGDDAAFDRLVALTKHEVVTLAYRYGLDATRADDIAQETFVRVWRARATYKPEARFRAWLLRIAANLIVTEVRTRRRTRTLGLPEEGDPATPLADPRSASPEAPAEREEIVEAVDRAIGELPANQRMALLMSRFHDQSYHEIGQALGIKPEAVKSLLFRARQSLKELLKDFAEDSTETLAAE